MPSNLKTTKPADKTPSEPVKDSIANKPVSDASDPAAAPKADAPAAAPDKIAADIKDDADRAADAANKAPDLKPEDSKADADASAKEDKKGGELRPGALTAASAGAPGLLPGQEVKPEEVPQGAPLSGIKDGGAVISTVNESGTSDGRKREVKQDREPLTGVNPVTGQPHAGQEPNLRDASMGAFGGDEPNRSSDQLTDPNALQNLGGQSGFDKTKSLASDLKDWAKGASDNLGALKSHAQGFSDAFEALFESQQAASPSAPSAPSQDSSASDPAAQSPSQDRPDSLSH